MRTKFSVSKLDVSTGADFSWPVKIRVGANIPQKAPRKSTILPASFSFQKKSQLILRTVEMPGLRLCRRAPGGFEWAQEAHEH
jgi:hypothetical protein